MKINYPMSFHLREAQHKIEREMSMKKSYLLLTLAAALVLGCCTACKFQTKVAVVDLATVVSNSAQVRALQADQNAKGQELAQWLQNAQEEVNKESDNKKKEALLQQYNAAFAQKREALAQQYAQQLQAVDASITQTIIDEAKKMGYTLVLAKGAAIYGGDDITEDVSKVVK